ncbi:class I SAM-dependent methyltransferase [Hydrogenophaga sp. 5NK40-0174]|uniref:class I SAM-dependent methyltransferase n=1 Tax=Hydrogenophaga sp. 5NK40-0174 TaxID=3127649 RepID=UPI0031030FCC
MNPSIIGLQHWFQTPPGQYLLEWEQAQFDVAVADIFGFNALQMGVPQLDTLQANRMPHRWLALPEPPPSFVGGEADEAHASSRSLGDGRKPVAALMTDPAAMPFPAGSLDLLVLPHTLELSADPHQVLREAERVLMPEGRLVISGLNPTSLWGLRQARGRLLSGLGLGATRAGALYLPEAGDFIGTRRLRDWLKLMSFDVESERYGCYRPAVRSEKWLTRWAWMDRMGARWWPIFGAVFFLVAVKRVRGMHLLGPAWKPRPARAAAQVPIANKTLAPVSEPVQAKRE